MDKICENAKYWICQLFLLQSGGREEGFLLLGRMSVGQFEDRLQMLAPPVRRELPNELQLITDTSYRSLFL